MLFRNRKKVAKFGGSSLADANQFKKVAAIVNADKARRYVVPSAPGKRHKEDIKITDMLIACQKTADYMPLWEQIKARYNGIIADLGLDISLDNEFALIENALAEGTTVDYMASRGEYLNGIILASFLGFEFVDAAEVVRFTADGKFDPHTTNAIMGERLSGVYNAVIPGFYGADEQGRVRIFARGGSDITGALVARAVMADIYENWTDVSGFLMCDPRIVENPTPIKTITYRELRELSYMGAGVLHEEAVIPVKLAGIPINIKNTNRPEDTGTMIVPESEDLPTDGLITGIAGKKDFAVIRIEKDLMNSEVGFVRKVLDVIASHGMSFEHLPSGIDTMCVVLSRKEIEGKEAELLTEITRAVSPDNIDVVTGVSLIAVVGRGMKSAKGTASRVFTVLAKNDINIRMIDQGSSELNIIIGVDDADFEKAIRSVYSEFGA